ncbi:hypothetical protein [Natronomonas sp. EA1]|uniref:hypothetical protein n=1 Tax=Natronomonas sp. EA1 TaxID=3421655 RepID=UPI003EBAF71B
MAELLVFTFLASIVAVYSILPRHRQLRVRYNLWTKPRFAYILIAFLVIIGSYWLSIYLESLEAASVPVSYGVGSVEVTPLLVESLQLVAVLGIVGLFLGVFLKSSVRVKNEGKIVSILRDLNNQGDYSTLVNLLQNHYRPLVHHPEEPQRQPSLAEVYARELREEVEDEPDSLRERVIRWYRAQYYVQLVNYWLMDTAPEASSYTETLFLDPEFSAQYPVIDPDLGVKLIRDDSLEGFQRRKAVHRYLRTLVKTENSLLYRDLQNNTSTDGMYRYKIEEDNRLIHALFSDMDRVEDLDIYKPVGDAVRDIIVDQRRQEFDEYNDQRLTDTRISDDHIFRDPVFIGIQFFDVLVKEAFHQKVSWHVWLSYYETFTREICRNYEITEYSDPDASVPNDYSRLLNEMVGNMCDWMRMMQAEVVSRTSDTEACDVPLHAPEEATTSAARTSTNKDKSSVSSETASTEDETGDTDEFEKYLTIRSSYTGRDSASIPKMTGIILVSCNEEILTTSEIPDRFKRDITERILLTGVELRNHGEGSLPWEYSELLLANLEERLTGRRATPQYAEQLQDVYADIRDEVFIEEDVGVDFVDRLDELIGHP